MWRKFDMSYDLPQLIMKDLSWKNTFTMVMVRNSPPQITQADIENLYCQFGKIIKIFSSQRAQKKQRYWFVIYDNILEAIKAIALTNHTYQFKSKKKINVILSHNHHDFMNMSSSMKSATEQEIIQLVNFKRYLSIEYDIPQKVMFNLSLTKTMTKIFITKLPSYITYQDLWAQFSKYGKIINVYFKKNQGQYCRSIGFIDYEDIISAIKAICLADKTKPFESKRYIKVVLSYRDYFQSNQIYHFNKKIKEIKEQDQQLQKKLKYKNEQTLVSSQLDEGIDNEINFPRKKIKKSINQCLNIQQSTLQDSEKQQFQSRNHGNNYSCNNGLKPVFQKNPKAQLQNQNLFLPTVLKSDLNFSSEFKQITNFSLYCQQDQFDEWSQECSNQVQKPQLL